MKNANIFVWVIMALAISFSYATAAQIDSIKSSKATLASQNIFDDFAKVPQNEREKYLQNLAKKGKFTYIYCSNDENARNFCGYKWDKLAGFKEIGNAWKKALESVHNDSGFFQLIAVNRLADYCRIHYPNVTLIGKEIERNPFGNSLQSTKELTHFIIEQSLVKLQTNEMKNVSWKKGENNNEEKRRREYFEESEIKIALFFMKFLDNLNALNIVAKSNEKPLCFVEK